MGDAIGIRLPDEILKKIEKLSREEMEDRSTVIRKLVIVGYKEIMQRRSAESYIKGVLTLSEASRQAGLTIWEMEKYLVERGFISDYSKEDIKAELDLLG